MSISLDQFGQIYFSENNLVAKGRLDQYCWKGEIQGTMAVIRHPMNQDVVGRELAEMNMGSQVIFLKETMLTGTQECYPVCIVGNQILMNLL